MTSSTNRISTRFFSCIYIISTLEVDYAGHASEKSFAAPVELKTAAESETESVAVELKSANVLAVLEIANMAVELDTAAEIEVMRVWQ